LVQQQAAAKPTGINVGGKSPGNNVAGTSSTSDQGGKDVISCNQSFTLFCSLFKSMAVCISGLTPIDIVDPRK
jgi:hypothetical protein